MIKVLLINLLNQLKESVLQIGIAQKPTNNQTMRLADMYIDMQNRTTNI
jgi:hypothetical protein